ncbi:MAG: hypothetical protein K0U59_11795 [Gammaproteobacteria bacterium]|nr:hypothetical protein [Gammaproteobacteria bacterium]
MFQEFEKIEQQIAQHQAQIQQLEEQRMLVERKKQAVIAFDKALVNLAAEYSVEETDMYVARGDQMVDWLLSQLDDEGAPEFVQSLKTRMARQIKREGEGGRRTRRSNNKARVNGSQKPIEPKLETGHYQNPYTGATVEKKKRNPKSLTQWIEEHGLETVKAWKV